jgi:hypothetical protein
MASARTVAWVGSPRSESHVWETDGVGVGAVPQAASAIRTKIATKDFIAAILALRQKRVKRVVGQGTWLCQSRAGDCCLILRPRGVLRHRRRERMDLNHPNMIMTAEQGFMRHLVCSGIDCASFSL